MSRFRAVLLAIGGLAIAAAAVLALRARQASGSPLASLRALAEGAHASDRHAIEQYLDVRRTAESVVDEARAIALAVGDSSSVDEGTKTLLIAALEQSIWTTLLDPAAADRFHGITDVLQRGDTARVGVRLRLEDGDSAAFVHLRMERAAGHWRVIGVEGLGPYMQAALARRRARAAATARER
jgi:hypothetical protein